MADLALGTAQFGLNYGINNLDGKVEIDEVKKILELAFSNGLDLLDTATAYGDSETVLGTCQIAHSFKIISKLPPCSASEVRQYFHRSLQRLGRRLLEGYLVHDYSSFECDNAIWDEMELLKASGLVKKIGFSLYYPDQLESLLSAGIQPDLIQVPFNILDQRFLPYFRELKGNNVEVHTRSTYLQGLFFIHTESLVDYFSDLRPVLQRINSILETAQVSMACLCLNYVLAIESIDKVIIGVDQHVQLEQNIRDRQYTLSNEIVRELASLAISDERFIVPSNWPA